MEVKTIVCAHCAAYNGPDLAGETEPGSGEYVCIRGHYTVLEAWER